MHADARTGAPAPDKDKGREAARRRGNEARPPQAAAADCRLTADAVVVAARPDGTVDLEFAPHTGCEGCRGTCLWKRLAAMRLDRLAVDGKLAPGSAVSVTIPAEPLLYGALATYGIPLVAILVGAAAGAAVSGNDLGTLAGALLALALVIAGFRLRRPKLERALLASLRILPRQGPRARPDVVGDQPGA